MSCLIIDTYTENEKAILFCKEFLEGNRPRYILGRNEYAESIARIIDVDGFIDDFTEEKVFLGKPVVKMGDVPQDSMVVSAVIGRPLTAERRLKEHNLTCLDYFAFKKYSNLDIRPIKFWEEFKIDFQLNRDRYEWVCSLLEDERSKDCINKLINFRLSYDLDYMRGFEDIQYRQYFEDFLDLRHEGEVFVDVGGFDGATSLEFIRRCPGYMGVHIFEPEPVNMAVIKKRLSNYPKINFYECGLSDRVQKVRFKVQGSSSQIDEEGEIEIKVERLDDIIREPFTFLKMDIEGWERWALEGAKHSIIKYHPRLAISVYHRHDDFWRIPQQILSYRNDYRLFLRHYTEGVDETVMFFVPTKG